MEEDIELRESIIYNRLKEMCPGSLITENFDTDYQLILDSAEQHNGLDLFIKSQRETNLLPTTAGRLKQLVDKNLKITDVAKYYGFKIKNKKMICPFHKDTSPSLSLSDEKNVFFCFGCRLRGDVIEFIRRLEEIGYKGTSN